MTKMFQNALIFNQDISGWDTSRVKDMSGMFNNALSFNQDISSWDTGRVISKKRMFLGAVSFSYGEKIQRPRWCKGLGWCVNYRHFLTGTNLISPKP